MRTCVLFWCCVARLRLLDGGECVCSSGEWLGALAEAVFDGQYKFLEAKVMIPSKI